MFQAILAAHQKNPSSMPSKKTKSLLPLMKLLLPTLIFFFGLQAALAQELPTTSENHYFCCLCGVSTTNIANQTWGIPIAKENKHMHVETAKYVCQQKCRNEHIKTLCNNTQA